MDDWKFQIPIINKWTMNETAWTKWKIRVHVQTLPVGRGPGRMRIFRMERGATISTPRLGHGVLARHVQLGLGFRVGLNYKPSTLILVPGWQVAWNNRVKVQPRYDYELSIPSMQG